MIHKTGLPLDNLAGYEIELWADGSADNVRKGRIGWGGVMVFKKDGQKHAVWYVWGIANGGTSPFAELLAIEAVLAALPSHDGSQITLHSDSEWAIRCLIGENQRQKFLDTWDDVNDHLHRVPSMRFVHVRGHVGIKENEQCHMIADYVRRLGSIHPTTLEKLVGHG